MQYGKRPIPSEAMAAARRSTLWCWLSTVMARIAGTASATNAAETGITSRAMLSVAQRRPRANEGLSSRLASRVSSGWIAVCTGWAMIA